SLLGGRCSAARGRAGGRSGRGPLRHGTDPALAPVWCESRVWFSKGAVMAGSAEDDEVIARGMYGPDVTFLGVPRVELDALDGYDVVFLGAPFDSGTSHRPGARFGPQAIRVTDYLPHDASRPHLALGVDPLAELRIGDAGDVVMPPGETEKSLKRLEDAVLAVRAAGAIPVILGGDHTITLPDATGVARHVGWGRVSLIHFDAHADTGDTQFGSLYGHGTPMRL